MRIGILETGRVSAELLDEHGPYPAMFEALLAPALPGASFRTWAVLDGTLPDSAADADAWLVTGSRHGVYDPLPWIEPLKAFLQLARSEAVPVIGVCFGHQILAEAFGGRAEKSSAGWRAGRNRYEVFRRPEWMADAPAAMQLHAMHQDQVMALPKDATLLAGNPFCPNAMVAYGDPEAPDAISIQPHPEFDAAYARALVERRLADTLSAEEQAAILRDLGAPVDNAVFAQWCARYLAAHRGVRAAVA